MGRQTGRRPLRIFHYVSDAKLANLLDQIDDRARRNILEKLQPTFGLNIVPVSLTVQPKPADRSVHNRSRALQVAVVEEHIRQQFQVGDLAIGDYWIAGRADMDWAPLPDGQTALFCGSAGPLLVALHGSAGNLSGQTSSGPQTGSYSYAIRAAVLNGGNPESLGEDLAAAARTMRFTPKPVRFLAQVTMRGILSGDQHREFVLATPLYVEDAHRPDETGDVLVQGMVRWFSADRGWGLVAPDGAEDPVVVDATVGLAEDSTAALVPGQRVEFCVTHEALGILATSVRPSAASLGEIGSELAAVTPGQSLDPGDPGRLGRYEVLRRLGEGSMGMVYLARSDDGSLVAIKVIRPEYARDPEFLRRFAAEAHNAGRVRTPHVARVITAVTDIEHPYLVTEFIDGPTLEEQVEQRGPLPAQWAVDAAAQIAAALDAIHRAGLVHRDLTPSNVILSGSGPKVIDFGIAHALGSDTRHTQAGRLIGTPAYMSPEQINDDRLTPASDIFSWAGATVFAATGHQPFASQDSPVPAIWRAISEGEPNLSGVPSQLRNVVAAALNKDPARRPTAAQLLEGLSAGRRWRKPGDAEKATLAWTYAFVGVISTIVAFVSFYARGSTALLALSIGIVLVGSAVIAGLTRIGALRARLPRLLLIGAIVIGAAIGGGIGLSIRPAGSHITLRTPPIRNQGVLVLQGDGLTSYDLDSTASNWGVGTGISWISQNIQYFPDQENNGQPTLNLPYEPEHDVLLGKGDHWTYADCAHANYIQSYDSKTNPNYLIGNAIAPGKAICVQTFDNTPQKHDGGHYALLIVLARSDTTLTMRITVWQ